MSLTISRRAFTAGCIVTSFGGSALVSLPALRAAAAQADTDLASLGLPTLDITVTPDGYEGIDTELQAGRYLVTATFAEELLGAGVDEAGVEFTRPPDGTSAEELIDMLDIGSRPTASPDASEAEQIQPEPFPATVFQSAFTGGPVGSPGDIVETMIDLPPGEWVLWSGETGPSEYVPPTVLTVTGDMPADLPEPDADVNVTLVDFTITVEGALTAGEHILRIENQGAQPHFLLLLKGPAAMTNDDITQLLESFTAGTDATPPDYGWDPEAELQYLMTTVAQSIGTTMWTKTTFEPGKYAALCHFPSAGTGEWHSLHGMHTVFEVA